jgi:hypothetical protein
VRSLNCMFMSRAPSRISRRTEWSFQSQYPTRECLFSSPVLGPNICRDLWIDCMFMDLYLSQTEKLMSRQNLWRVRNVQRTRNV